MAVETENTVIEGPRDEETLRAVGVSSTPDHVVKHIRVMRLDAERIGELLSHAKRRWLEVGTRMREFRWWTAREGAFAIRQPNELLGAESPPVRNDPSDARSF